MPCISKFQDGEHGKTREVGEGIIVDYAEDGKVIGIEILEASHRMPMRNIEEITVSFPKIKGGAT